MVTTARAESATKKRIRTGVAISATEICAADIRLRGSADRVWRAPLEAPPTDGGSWPSLVSAFADLARTLGSTNGTLSVSLMPPLTEVRRLDLPPLRNDELQRLLTRNSARYFVNARGPQFVGAVATVRSAKAGLTPVVAAAVSMRLVMGIRNAAEQSGFVIDSIAPAESGWAAAGLSLWPTFAKQNAWVVVATDERTELLQIDSGCLTGVRRFRPGAADASMLADAVGSQALIGVVGLAARRREVISALGALGLTPATAIGEWAPAVDRTDVLAAHFAGDGNGLVFRAEEAMALDRANLRRRAWTIGGAAAAMLIVAAAIELWGVHRQLRLVQAERATLQPQIASTLVGRTTVEATYRHLSTLGAIERSSPQWSAVIAALSDAVPNDAHLTAIRARDDSLIVDGLAEHAARVFDALESTKLLSDVKAPAPVRRELQADGTPLDHFTISARVVRPPAPTPVPTAPSRGANQ
ncbi:MAG: PilN domain-containing protein [Gemmatimonadaceae bacterium]